MTTVLLLKETQGLFQPLYPGCWVRGEDPETFELDIAQGTDKGKNE